VKIPCVLKKSSKPRRVNLKQSCDRRNGLFLTRLAFEKIFKTQGIFKIKERFQGTHAWFSVPCYNKMKEGQYASGLSVKTETRSHISSWFKLIYSSHENPYISCEPNRSVSQCNRSLWEPWLSRSPIPRSVTSLVCVCCFVLLQPIPLGVTFSKAQSSKLERLFCHVSVKRDVEALSFELLKQHSKMSPQVGLLLENWCLKAGKSFDLLREVRGGLRKFIIKRPLFDTFMPQSRQKTSFLHLCAPNTLFGILSYPSDRKTHVLSIIPSFAKPWRIWRGCSYQNHFSRIYLLTSLLLQTSKETCARSNMKFWRTDQSGIGIGESLLWKATRLTHNSS